MHQLILKLVGLLLLKDSPTMIRAYILNSYWFSFGSTTVSYLDLYGLYRPKSIIIILISV